MVLASAAQYMPVLEARCVWMKCPDVEYRTGRVQGCTSFGM